MERSYKKAGIIVIGDEILKGHVVDTNSSFLCKRLHAIGVKVCRVTMVADQADEIAEEVMRFSEKFDIVLTTGGIGPTHDDITYEGIALAFKERIVLHSEMAEVIRSYFHGSCRVETNPALRMALVPQNSKLIYVLPKPESDSSNSDGHSGLQGTSRKEKKPFPVVQVKNVYVLPGVRVWLEHAFNHLENIFKNASFSLYTMTMFLKAAELNVVKQLDDAVSKFRKQVFFGSYSMGTSKEYQTKITLEGTSLDEVTAAYSYLISNIPKEYLPRRPISEDASIVYDLAEGFRPLSVVVRNSLKVIEMAMAKYTKDEIYLSFNGGKDCTALLHLIWAVGKKTNDLRLINAIYIKADESFPEVDEFINKMEDLYNLNVLTISGPIKDALQKLHMNKKEVKAIFMGTRRTDPHAGDLKDFQLCDEDWPPLMRVNPILNWSYEDVWSFLRILSIPYCSLYDEGYTSIGSPRSTTRNPALKVEENQNKYQPAYKLKEGALERINDLTSIAEDRSSWKSLVASLTRRISGSKKKNKKKCAG